MTATVAARRSSLAHRAAEGTVAAYLWDESTRVEGRRRPAARRWAPGKELRRSVATPGTPRGRTR